MNRNLLLTVAALFAIGASGANAAQVDFYRNTTTEKFDKKEVSSYQSGGHGHLEFDKTETTIGSATGGAGGAKSRKSTKGELDCQRFACANGKH